LHATRVCQTANLGAKYEIQGRTAGCAKGIAWEKNGSPAATTKKMRATNIARIMGG